VAQEARPAGREFFATRTVAETLAGFRPGRRTPAETVPLAEAWHRVPAVLKEDAPVAQPAVDGSTTGLVRAIVRWTGPDGAVHSGTARVHEGSKAGTATEIWTDGRGSLVQRPPTPEQIATRAVLAGTSAAAGVGAVSLAGRGVARWRLDRARVQEWGRAWAEVGPRWSRHIR